MRISTTAFRDEWSEESGPAAEMQQCALYAQPSLLWGCKSVFCNGSFTGWISLQEPVLCWIIMFLGLVDVLSLRLIEMGFV